MESKILFTKEQILTRIKEIAKEVRTIYQNENLSEVRFVWLENGAKNFAQELYKQCALDVKMDSIKVSSYGNNLTSSGKVKVANGIEKLKAKRILLIDDIIDTGTTAQFMISELKKLGVEEIKTCFLLNKVESNKSGIIPDFYAFVVENLYVYGFGLDLKGEFRDLPEIYSITKM